MPRGPFGAALLPLVLLPLAGCVEEGSLPEREATPPPAVAAKSLVLRFTLVNMGETQGTSAGHHCGTVRVRADTATIETEGAKAPATSKPILLEFPKLEGPWATTGSNPFWELLPAEADTGIHNERTLIGKIDWSNDRPTVDGKPVALPHSWTAHDPEHKWRADATLETGPEKLVYEEQRMCM